MVEVGTVLGTTYEDFGDCIVAIFDLVKIASTWLNDLRVSYITEAKFKTFDEKFTWVKFLWVLEWVKKNVSGIKSKDTEALAMIKAIDVKDFVGKFKFFRTNYVISKEEPGFGLEEPSHVDRIMCSEFLGTSLYEGRRLHWALMELYWDVVILWKRQRMCAFLLLARKGKTTGTKQNLFTLLQATEIVKKIADYCYN